MRWERADGRMMPPSDFITVAEETGLIVPLTYQVLGRGVPSGRRVAADVRPARWHLSVNISSKLFSRPEFIDEVEDALRESGLLPGTLRLEIPESVLIESLRCRRRTLRSSARAAGGASISTTSAPATRR